MARKDPQINIRIPADLKSQLEGAAGAGGRSVTAEIITRLQASFAPAQAQDMFSTPDFQHRLKEQTLHERIQLTNNQIVTLQMHQNVLHMRLQALAKEGEQGGLFDAREQLADAEQNLKLLLSQREALLLESQQLDSAYQDAVRPLHVKAAAMTEKLLEPERRAIADKLRESSERLGKLKPTQTEIDAAIDAEVAKNSHVLRAIAGRTGAVAHTGGDEAPYKVKPAGKARVAKVSQQAPARRKK